MSSKECKYSCGILISWNQAKSVFVESDGTEHSKERCAYVKSLKKPAAAATPAASPARDDPTRELAAAIRELAAAIRSRPA